MRLGVRGKLFGVSLLAIFGAVAASGFYLEPTLREWLESRIEQELTRHAKTARDLAESTPALDSIVEVDSLADRLGSSIEARVTFISPSGYLLGDSQLNTLQIKNADNHGRRPEVLEAYTKGIGVNRRYSITLKTKMLYVAIPYKRQHNVRGIVRVATPLSAVDKAISWLRTVLLITALVGMGVALFIGGWSSYLWSRPMLRLVEHARAITRGERPGKLVFSPKDELGPLAGSFNQKVDELERLVSDLGAERDRFEAVLEGMSEGLVVLDSSQRITHLNRRASFLLSLSPAPLGRTLLEEVRVPALHDLLAKTENQKRGEPKTTELDVISEGRVRRLLATATTQKTDGVILVFHDLTELRRLRTIRQDFIANVSHELRTPVSVILANAETLLDGALEDSVQAKKFVEALKRSADRLSALIADLLDLSRLDSKHTIPLGTVNIAAVAKQTLITLDEKAQQKALAIINKIPDSLFAHANFEALQQVLTNLVENAIKYTSEGQIKLQASLQEDNIRIEVEDDGPGIAPRHQDRIFERFYRVDRGRSRELGGTGLGLSIVKNLVELMSGQIEYVQAKPKGSIFRLILGPADK